MSTVSMNSTATPRIVVAAWVVVALCGIAIVAAAVLAALYAGLPTPDLVIGS
jgi:nucleoside phosphorylase